MVTTVGQRVLSAFLRAAAASLEGVEVIEQANSEGDHAANGLAEVGVREVRAQTRGPEESSRRERLKRQLDWSEPLATWLFRHSANCLSRYRIQNDGKRLISDAQESVGGVKLLNSDKKQHSYLQCLQQ